MPTVRTEAVVGFGVQLAVLAVLAGTAGLGWAGSLAGTYVPPGPSNPIKARWLGIIDGAGIHGIDPSEYGSIGTAGSHGCVRMRIPDVIDLYPRVPVGAPIYIA